LSFSSPEETATPQDLRPEALDRALEIQLLRTLIIEPTPELAQALAGLAAGRGHDVISAATCAEAMATVAAAVPDLLLVRLNHETANLVAEFLPEVLAQGAATGVQVLALTDDDEPSSRVEAWLKRGFHDFIAFSAQTSPSLLRNRLAIAEHSLLRQRAQARAALSDSTHAKRFEELYLKSPEATLVVTARDGYILEINPAAESILGVPRQDLVQRYLSLVLPTLFDHEEYDPQLLNVNESIRLTEIPYQRPDGAKRCLDGFLTKISWPQANALLLRFQDITALKEREQRRLLEARQDATSHALLGVARELSDALTTVRGNLELLARIPPARAEARELMTGANLGCDDAERLVQKISTLGRRQQGVDFKKRPLALKSLLEKAVSFALLGGKSRPVLHVSDDLWPIEGDEGLLAEVFHQLVTNADEAMVDGGTIFVDARNIREKRSQIPDAAGVSIRLRDQGVGIASEKLARVFDPFYSTKGKDGMGLALAAAAIRAHGGRIQIDSAPGEGTTVDLWLPVNIQLLLGGQTPAMAVGNQSAKSPLTPPQILAEPRSRILFMDDEAQIRVLVQKILTAHGFDVYCTNDGQAAIDAYRKAHEFGAPFDVILMDLDVRGGMGGMEAVARLRAEFPNLKALLTTGYIDDALLDSHREHGFLGVIPKPFQVERLVGVVGKLAGVKI
jgi:PAS domain S-box-containing protein